MEAKGLYVDRKQLIELATADMNNAIKDANDTLGGLLREEVLQLAQARALVAIADTLASIDRRLERLIETLENRGPL